MMKHLKIIFPLLLLLILSCGFFAWWLDHHFAPPELKAANALIEEKKFPQAIHAYQELVKKFPEGFVQHYNLGNLYFHGQQYAPAEQSYKQSLNTPDLNLRRYALYNLGDAAFCQNKLKEALHFFEAALAMDSAYDKARQNADFTRRIQSLMKENPDQAAQILQESCLKMNEEKKEEDKKEKDKKEDKKEEQKKDQEDKKDQKSGEQKEQQQNGQKQDEQQNQQESGDKDQQKQEQQGQDQQQDQQQGAEKDQQQQGQGQEKQEPEGQEPQDQQAQGAAGSEEKGEFQGRYDANPEPWLNSLSDDPSRALKYLIRKKGMDKKHRFDKNW